MGRAVSLALAAEGCNLVVHYNRSADAALEVVAAAEAAGVGALAVGADLADAVAPEVIFDAAAVLGPPTLLVNSASAFPADRLTDLNRAIWENTLAVSLSAPLFLARELACRLDGETQGAVVNITDWRSARPYPDHVAYTVAKGGLDALTAAAAVVLAPSIRVNAVALGAILPPPGEGSQYLRDLAGSIPLRRVGGVEPVQEAVVFLAKADFITGETIRVDGGAHLV